MAGQFDGAETIGGIVGEVGIDAKGVDTGVDHVKAKLNSLKPNFQALESMARKVFIGLLGIGGFAVKSFADAEQADMKLRSSLEQSLEQTKNSKAGIDALANSLDKVKGKSITVSAKANTNTTAGVPKIGDLVAANQNASLDATMQKLSSFAEALQRVTIYSRNAVKEQMAFAMNLGVTAEDLEGVTKIGAGLATTLFGGDLHAGIEAASKAYSGNFRNLQKLIPGLKDAGTAQQKWAMVIAAGQSGMKQAEENANTFSGATQQLWHEVQSAAASFGEILVPQLKIVGTFIEAITLKLQNLTPAQKQQVVHWAEIAAGVAALVAFGPAIVSFGSAVVGTFMAIGEAVVGVGAALVGIVAGPVGLVIAGLAALATGFMYAIGAGNTFTERTIDGFMQVVSFLDHMFGSWAGFVQGLVTLWDQMQFAFEDAWISIKKVAIEVWEYLKANFPEVVYVWGGALAKFASQAWDVMRKLGASIKHLWQEVVDYIANKMAESMVKSQAMADIRKQYEGRVLTKQDANTLAADEMMSRTNSARRQAGEEADDKSLTGGDRQNFIEQRMKELFTDAQKKEITDRYQNQYAGKKLDDGQLQALIDKETTWRLNQLANNKTAEEKAREAEHQARMAAINADAQARIKAIDQWSKDGMKKTPLEHAREREEALKHADEERAKLEAERAKTIADDLKKLNSMPKLSDAAKALYDNIQKHLGLGDIKNFIDDIQKQADALKAQAKEQVNGVKAPGMNPNFTDPNAGKAGKTIEEAFKENLRKTLLPAALMNQQEAQKKRDDEAKKKQEEANRKALLEAQKKQANAADNNTEQLKTLNERLQQPLTMGLA